MLLRTKYVFRVFSSFAVCVACSAAGQDEPLDKDQPSSQGGRAGASTAAASAGVPAVAGTSGVNPSGGSPASAGASQGGSPGAASGAGGGTASATSGSANGGSAPTGGTTAGGGSAGGVTSCAPLGFERPLPIPVDDNFQPAGYFASPPANTAAILQEDCAPRPAGGSIGKCHKFSFQAVTLENNAAYAGVFWQHGTGNWGDNPGLNAAPGATKVTFRAWGAVGGEVVSFSVGGLCGATVRCKDTVCLGDEGGSKLTLTTTPTDYAVSLKGMTYPNGISGGFVWSAATLGLNQKVTFFVDNIQWVQ